MEGKNSSKFRNFPILYDKLVMSHCTRSAICITQIFFQFPQLQFFLGNLLTIFPSFGRLACLLLHTVPHWQKLFNFILARFELMFQKGFPPTFLWAKRAVVLTGTRARYSRGLGAQPLKMLRFFTHKILRRWNFAIEMYATDKIWYLNKLQSTLVL